MSVFRVLAAAALLSGSTAAAAAVQLVSPVFAPITGTFVEVLPGGNGAGVYGVELRGGDNASAATWEIGVGKATSQSNFNQGQFNWGCGTGGSAGCGTVQNFSLTWTATALSITVGATTVNSPTGANLAALTGNTLKVFVKRDATLTINNIDGTAFAVSATGNAAGSGNATNELFFYSPDNFGGNGFTATGTVRIKGGGNSANEILFKHGTYTPAVPEPATWALMISGFGLVGAAARRRRTALTS